MVITPIIIIIIQLENIQIEAKIPYLESIIVKQIYNSPRDINSRPPYVCTVNIANESPKVIEIQRHRSTQPSSSIGKLHFIIKSHRIASPHTAVALATSLSLSVFAFSGWSLLLLWLEEMGALKVTIVRFGDSLNRVLGLRARCKK